MENLKDVLNSVVAIRKGFIINPECAKNIHTVIMSLLSNLEKPAEFEYFMTRDEIVYVYRYEIDGKVAYFSFCGSQT